MKRGQICKRRCHRCAVSIFRFNRQQKRPALVVADLSGDDIIICLITSQNARDNYAISLSNEDFETGSLRKNSNLRPNRLFTIDAKVISYRVGNLKTQKMQKITDKILQIFS